MRTFSSLLLSCSLLLLTTTVVHARPEMANTSSAERFRSMDADQNGIVSRDEFFKAQPQMREAAFEAIDTNKDTTLTLDEWEVFTQGHGKQENHGMNKAMQENKEAEQPAKNATKQQNQEHNSAKHDLVMPSRSKK